MNSKKNNSVKTPKRSIILTVLILLINGHHQTSQAAEGQSGSIKNWRELASDRQYSISQSFRFYRLKTENGSLATLIVLDLNDQSFTLKPFFNQQTNSVSHSVKTEKALAGINGGFFNLSNGESTSYVVIDGKNQCEPKQNKALVDNPQLKPYLETVFNRSELRILEDGDHKRKASINLHNDPVANGWTLIHSLQAGPALLPTITDSEEAFTRKSADGKLIDAIGLRRKAARTAIGITHDNHILFLCVANKNQDEFSSGATLAEVATILQDLGCTKAINLDGGTSTTMVVAEGDSRDEETCRLSKVVSSEPEKLVKSGWIIEKRSNQSHSRYPTSTFPR